MSDETLFADFAQERELLETRPYKRRIYFVRELPILSFLRTALMHPEQHARM